MLISNVFLMEAAEKSTVKPAKIAADIKKLLQTCRLTKFRSVDSCLSFFSTFFCQMVESEDVIQVNDWGIIYGTLMNDPAFMENLALFMSMYQPAEYTGMFQALYNQAMSEYETCGTRKVLFLGNVKSIFNMLDMKFDEIRSVVTPQIKSMDVIKFLTIVGQVLRTYQVQLTEKIQAEISTGANTADISPSPDSVSYENYPLEEDAQEFIYILEHADEYIAKFMGPMNEGIVNNAKEKARSVAVGIKKAERMFDEFVMKKYRELTINRQNRKHSEMVGESLRITHEIKRLLKSGALAILSPSVGVWHWIITFFIDKVTDKKDRNVLIKDLRDAIEIIDEKINMAERNGDDKAKIDLMRARQKYIREYERITKIKYDASRRADIK